MVLDAFDEEMQRKDETQDGLNPRLSSDATIVANKEGNESDSPTLGSDVEAGYPLGKLDWDSPDDVGDPHNWSFKKRAFHTAIPALYGFVM